LNGLLKLGDVSKKSLKISRKNWSRIVDNANSPEFTTSPSAIPVDVASLPGGLMPGVTRIPRQEQSMATASSKPLSKSEILNALAESTGLSRKDVGSVFEELGNLISKNIGKKGPGVFVVPGLMKIQVIQKEATKGGMRPNPFKPGEMMKVAPKPARRTIKVRPLKNLKDMA
jgi:nucleoid DNA-binding protein